MPRQRSRQRRLAFETPKPKVIIACEGEKTERGYFEGIRRSLRLPNDLIQVARHRNTDPRGIVQIAIDEKHEVREWNGPIQAWAVFDGDEHQHDLAARENWNDALQLARFNKIELAISNPAFELWYLLHYQDQRSYLDRTRAKELLRRHLPDYEKADKLYPEQLGERTEAAIARAKEIARIAEANGRPDYENPHCSVWRLVELLLSMAN